MKCNLGDPMSLRHPVLHKNLSPTNCLQHSRQNSIFVQKHLYKPTLLYILFWTKVSPTRPQTFFFAFCGIFFVLRSQIKKKTLQHSIINQPLQHCILQHCILQHCILQHSILQHCILQHCILQHCIINHPLQHIILQHCILHHSIINHILHSTIPSSTNHYITPFHHQPTVFGSVGDTIFLMWNFLVFEIFLVLKFFLGENW